MVSAIENRAHMTAIVVSYDAGGTAGVQTLVVRVEAAEDEPGFPNLLKAAVGSTVTLRIRAEGQTVPAPASGARIFLRARLAAPGVLVGDAETLRLE